MKKPGPLLLLGGAAICILGGVWLHLNLRGRRSALQQAQAQIAEKVVAQRRDLADLGQQIEAARSHYRDLLENTSPAKAPEIVATPVNPGPPSTPTPNWGNARNARIGASPELRQASVQAFAYDQILTFGGILRRLGLTPSQIERFKENQVEYQNRLLDVAVAAHDQGLARTSPELAALGKEKIQDWAQQADRELFGPLYPQWMEQAGSPRGG